MDILPWTFRAQYNASYSSKPVAEGYQLNALTPDDRS
jgi:hypothetical protein